MQWEQNGGQCGVCGDAHHVRSPRPHEAGGEYAKGIISHFYTAGQVRIQAKATNSIDELTKSKSPGALSFMVRAPGDLTLFK